METISEKKFFHGWIVLAGMTLAVGLTWASNNVFGSMFTVPVCMEFGIGRGEFALNSTIIGLMGILAGIAAARFYSKYKVKYFQAPALVVYIIGFVIRFFAANIINFYISSFFVGISMTIIISGGQIIIKNWFIKQRGLAIGILIAGMNIMGATLSPMLQSIISGYGWRNGYLLLAGLLTVVMLPIILIVKGTPEEKGLKPLGFGEAPVAPGKKKRENKSSGINYSVSQAFKRTFFYIFLLGTFLNGFLGGAILGQLIPYLGGLHGPALAALFLSANSLLAILTKILVGTIADRWGARTAMVAGYTGFILTFVLLLYAQSIHIFWILTFMYAVAGAAAPVTQPLLLADTFGDKGFGAFIGINSMINQGGMSIGAAVGGFIFDILGSYNVLWTGGAIGIACLIICYFCASVMSRKNPPVVPAPATSQ